MDAELTRRLDALEERLGTEFKDRKLLIRALTHRSYLNENPSHPTGHNERLEFLGDSILQTIVTEQLYRAQPDASEGQLTNTRAALVSTATLGPIGIALGLTAHVFLSKGERRSVLQGGEKVQVYICTCAVEAIIGALYLDQGFGACRLFVDAHVIRHARTLVADWKDDISNLQDEAQKRWGITPAYRVLSQEGPAHAMKFRVGCDIGGIIVAEGSGSSKKEAKVGAAKCARETTTQWEGRVADASSEASASRRSGKAPS